MNDIQRGILLLLKSAVTGEKYPLPGSFALEDAMEIVRKHGVQTMIYQGAVNCGMDADTSGLKALSEQYIQAFVRSERQMKAVRKICRAFDENKIDYMPLKGSRLKGMYPRPELRQMGDADILIRFEQYDRIKPVMQELGFDEKYESNHELAWKSPELFVELHKYLIPSYNKDYFAYFGNGWRLAAPEEGTRYGLAAEDEYVYLFTHFAKHYRDAGIGLKHAMDLWVYRNKHPEMDWGRIEGELGKLQLLEFNRNVMKMLSVWFDDANADDKAEFMTRFIFDSGSWGHRENQILTMGIKQSNAAGSAKKGRIISVVQAFFPPVNALNTTYGILRKAPWLLPVVWVVRWADVLLHRRGNINRKKTELIFATADRIDDYRKTLQYVGLDFNFKE